MNPKNAHAYFRRGFSYKAIKVTLIQKYKEAAYDFEKAKKLDPLDPMLVLNYNMLDKIDVIALCNPGEEKNF